MEIVASIDVGSNAIRGIVAELLPNDFRRLKKIRIPLSLGEEVFRKGTLGPAKTKEAIQAFLKIKKELSKYEVTRAVALATSAMRDAKNGKEFCETIFKKTGIQISIIDGFTEAKLIYEAVLAQVNLSKQLAVLVDIGGGSTEVTVVDDQKIIASQSFNIGTVRLNVEAKDFLSLSHAVWPFSFEMKNYLEKVLKGRKIDRLVGTGGNLRRLGKVKQRLSKGFSSAQKADFSEVNRIFRMLKELTPKQRVKRMGVTLDRAEVILPATYMMSTIMNVLGCEQIDLPTMGLKEGIVLSILHGNEAWKKQSSERTRPLQVVV